MMTLQEQVQQAQKLGYSLPQMRQNLLNNISVAERMVSRGRSIYGPKHDASWASQLEVAKRLLTEFDATY
jgi:hypothetical protein